MNATRLVLLCNFFIVSHLIYSQAEEPPQFTELETISFYDSLGLDFYTQGLALSRSAKEQGVSLFEKADSLLGLSLQLKEQVKPIDNLDIAFSYHKIGNVKGTLRNYKLALVNYHKSLEIRQALLESYDPDVLNLYKNVAQAYRNIGENEKAILYFEKSIHILSQHYPDDFTDLGRWCFFLGLTQSKNGDVQEAIANFKLSIGYLSKNLKENQKALSNSYHELGKGYYLSDQFDLALKAYLKALELRDKQYGTGHYRLVSSYLALGDTYRAKGAFEHAMEYLHKARKVQIEHLKEDDPRLATTFTNLGLTQMEVGEYILASRNFNKVLDITIKHHQAHPQRIAYAYNNLAALHSRTGDFEKCEHYIEEAFEIYSRHSEVPHPFLAQIIHNLGAINFRNGNLTDALDNYEKALDMFRLIYKGKEHTQIANVYDDLGVLYLDMKDQERAKFYIEMGLKMRLDILGETHVDVAESKENLGLIYSAHEKYDTSKYLINEAKNIFLEFVDQNHPSVLSTLANLANQYEKSGHIAVADSIWHNTIPNLHESLKSQYVNMSNTQRIDYLNKIRKINDDFYSYAAHRNSAQIKELAANYLLNTKSLALDYSISTEKLIKQINDPLLLKQHDKLNELTDSISIINQMPSSQNTPDILELEEERVLIANQILEHVVLKSKLNIKEVHWKDIQSKLTSTEAAIDFVRVENKQDSSWIYYAIIISKHYSIPQFVKTINDVTLKQLLKVNIRQYPEYLQNRGERKLLYNELWKPISSFLTDVKTVHVSPIQALYTIPFESLQDEKNNFLVEEYTFHYYTSLRDVQEEHSQITNYHDILLLGNISYTVDQNPKQADRKGNLSELPRSDQALMPRIKPLPETLMEIDEIRKISSRAGISSHVLASEKASEEAVNSYTEKKAPSIVHFATHGVSTRSKKAKHKVSLDDTFISSDNPLQKSALLLAGVNGTWENNGKIKNDPLDGMLTALEVTTMDLQNTHLVVLSACRTGLGSVYNSEGVFGLQRAFKIAGVDHVIASLWDVDDKATKDLMVSFYHHLLDNKVKPAIALRRAKEELKETGYDPIDWSGFLLIE